MTRKRYVEMDNVELTEEAKRIACSFKEAGRSHYSLLYTLAFRIEEISGQKTPPTPVRCRTIEDVEEQRGMSREARAYIRHRDGSFGQWPSRNQTHRVWKDGGFA